MTLFLAVAGVTAVSTPAEATQACKPDPSWVCEKVFEWTGSDRWSSVAEWFVAKPLAILLIVLVAWVVNRIVRRIIKRSMQRMLVPGSHTTARWIRDKSPDVLLRTDSNNLRTEARVQTLSTVFRGLASAGIWLVAVLWILSILNVNLGPIVATAGVAGVALGFGAQYMIRDFLAGIFMVIEDQLGVGDIVDLGDAKGTVEKVTLRSTRLRDVQGVVWHVPNGQIQRVANKSHEWARAVLDLEVGFDTDVAAAEGLIQSTSDALAAEPSWQTEILETPEVWGVESFTKTGMTIRVVLKTRPASQFGVMRELRARLKMAFDANGIQLAGAGRNDVWVHSASDEIDELDGGVEDGTRANRDGPSAGADEGRPVARGEPAEME
jgi:small-conductance mechanosensitive channel